MSHGLSKPINVANVVNDGRIGGPQKRIVQIASGLRVQGVETKMFFPYMGEDLPDYLEANQMSYVNIEVSRPRVQKPMLSTLKYLARFPFEVANIHRALRTHSIDLVHVNGPFTLQPLVAARLAGLPVVWHLNDTTLSPAVYIFLKRMFGWLASIRAYSSKRVISHYRDERSGKSTLLYPPVDMSKFQPSQQSCDGFGLFQREPDELVLITVGNVNPTKGYLYLVRALARLKDLDCKWRLVIVGAVLDTNNEYYENIVSEIASNKLSERIIFAGSRNDIPDMLAQSDIFILGSVCEAGPMVLLEAMASGLPVVATDVGFVNEIIVNKENGLIVPIRDDEKMADAIKTLLLDGDMREKFAGVVRDPLRDKFSVEKITEATMAVYTKVLKIPAQ